MNIEYCIMHCQGLIGLAAMVHEPLYHDREKATIKYLLVVLAKRNQQDLAIFLDCFVVVVVVVVFFLQ